MNAYIINIFGRECSSLAETVHPAALNDFLTGRALSRIANTCRTLAIGMRTNIRLFEYSNAKYYSVTKINIRIFVKKFL